MYGNDTERQLTNFITRNFKGNFDVNAKHQLDAADRKLRQLDQENQALLREVKALRNSSASAEKVYNRIVDLLTYEPDPPEWVSPKHKSSTRGCPVTIWSDWHYGEVVRRAETNGVNAFNTTIAKKRVERLVNVTVDLAFHHMGNAKAAYPGVVVCLGGDMIGGSIHPELEATNEVTTQVAMFEVADIIKAALLKMADAFGKVFVPCVVGNHARSTLKPRFKQAVFTSNELVVYNIVKNSLAGDTRFTFIIPQESDAFFNVYNHRFMLTHGDNLGVKGGDGIIGALGPIMRGTMKLHNSQAAIGRDFDTALICHWHQYIPLAEVIVNNALKGYDEYARLKLRAKPSRPSQALFFVHPDHGITAMWEVYLEERHRANRAKWVSWYDGNENRRA